jgi:hypothetical protein
MRSRRARTPAAAAIAGHIADVLGAAAAAEQACTPSRPGAAWLARLVAASRWLAHLLERRWVAYPALVVLQLKVVWGDWDYRDLTPGDTADYFVFAYGWATHLTVEIVRSPLYTAFYGSLLHLSSDAAQVTYLHRLLIVLASDLLLLALLRRLLPADVAWLVAAWWSLLLGTFDVMYEVHLFGVLPLLLAGLVAAALPAASALGRGVALASLLAGALLVRNETVVPLAARAVACLVYELRQPPTRHTLLAYAAPLSLVVLLAFGLYLRSTVRFPAILDDLRAKHTLNVCQVYAFAYAEQHPDWSDSPWTECNGLMQATFGQPRPTLLEALRANPVSMLGEFVWNARLARAGLEFALFNAASSPLSPDFAHVQTGEPLPRALGVALVLLIAGGASCLLRDHGLRVAARAQPVWGWLVLFAGGLGAAVVLVVERPRAEYLYGLTILLMAAAGWSASVLASRWRVSQRWRSAAVGLLVCALALWPGYYAIGDHARPRDLLDTYQRLRPFSAVIADPNTRFLKGDYNTAVASYLGHRADGVLDYSVLDERDPFYPLAPFLAQRGINLLYLDEPLLETLEATRDPIADSPERLGWHALAADDTPAARWRLLERERGVSDGIRTHGLRSHNPTL